MHGDREQLKNAHDAVSDAVDDDMLSSDEALFARLESAQAGGDPSPLERAVALADRRRVAAARRRDEAWEAKLRRHLAQIDDPTADWPAEVRLALAASRERIMRELARIEAGIPAPEAWRPKRTANGKFHLRRGDTDKTICGREIHPVTMESFPAPQAPAGDRCWPCWKHDQLRHGVTDRIAQYRSDDKKEQR